MKHYWLVMLVTWSVPCICCCGEYWSLALTVPGTVATAPFHRYQNFNSKPVNTLYRNPSYVDVVASVVCYSSSRANVEISVQLYADMLPSVNLVPLPLMKHSFVAIRFIWSMPASCRFR